MKAQHLPQIIISERLLQLFARFLAPVKVSQLESGTSGQGMLASAFPKCVVEIRMSTRLGNTLEAIMVAADRSMWQPSSICLSVYRTGSVSLHGACIQRQTCLHCTDCRHKQASCATCNHAGRGSHDIAIWTNERGADGASQATSDGSCHLPSIWIAAIKSSSDDRCMVQL